MNDSITENVQQQIRPGTVVDLYYVGDTNSQKQAFSCMVDNKFKTAFTNLGAGVSQFVISPAQGVSDVIAYFKFPAGANTNCFLPQGWGYHSLIRQVSVRYGSSAQYFFTGAQLYAQTLWEAENSDKALNLSLFGGNATNDISGAAAYVYINLPHNSPRAEGKPLPFPSDLLVQPIVLTIELNPLSQVVLADGTGAVSGVPSALSDAWIQVKQEKLADTSNLLARRVDMNTHAYTYPLKYFAQQEIQIPVSVGATGTASVNLTGFRSGEVRNILLWLTANANDAVQGPGYWVAMSDILLTYNGDQIYRADSASNQVWAMVCDSKAPAIAASISDGAGALASSVTQWTDIPFSQVNVPYDREMKLVHGKPVLNAVIQLNFTAPVPSASYTLHACYIYNSSLLCSRGSSEYVF